MFSIVLLTPNLTTINKEGMDKMERIMLKIINFNITIFCVLLKRDRVKLIMRTEHIICALFYVSIDEEESTLLKGLRPSMKFICKFSVWLQE